MLNGYIPMEMKNYIMSYLIFDSENETFINSQKVDSVVKHRGLLFEKNMDDYDLAKRLQRV